jgi:hypothetical protein
VHYPPGNTGLQLPLPEGGDRSEVVLPILVDEVRAHAVHAHVIAAQVEIESKD